MTEDKDIKLDETQTQETLTDETQQPEEQKVPWHIGGFSKITATTNTGPCTLEFPTTSTIEDLSVFVNLLVNIVKDIATKHAEAKLAAEEKAKEEGPQDAA